jgi:multidrug resistance efflux pump
MPCRRFFLSDSRRFIAALVIIIFGMLLSAAGCRKSAQSELHGYVEGEFVYISAQLPGTVTLLVEKGITASRGSRSFHWRAWLN